MDGRTWAARHDRAKARAHAASDGDFGGGQRRRQRRTMARSKRAGAERRPAHLVREEKQLAIVKLVDIWT